MRALVLQAPGNLVFGEVPVPHPNRGEVLVRVEAATTCGTDLKAFLRGHPQIPMPGVFGHEYSGVVAAAGDDAPFHVGEDVMGVHSAPCQRCYWCVRGQENLCESIMATKVLGSYAEYLLVPARIARINLFHKPDHLSFDQASLLEPLSCVAQAVEMLHLRPDTSALIIGPGAIGLMFVAALRMKGVADITLAGRNQERLEVGTRLGAKSVQYSSLQNEDPRRYDVVIESTGTTEVWERSVDFARRGGHVVLFGGCPSGTSACFDTRKLHYDQITLLSPFHFGSQAVRTAREWLLDTSLDLSPLLSGNRDLSEGEQVFSDLKNGKGLKFVFKPNR